MQVSVCEKQKQIMNICNVHVDTTKQSKENFGHKIYQYGENTDYAQLEYEDGHNIKKEKFYNKTRK